MTSISEDGSLADLYKCVGGNVVNKNGGRSFVGRAVCLRIGGQVILKRSAFRRGSIDVPVGVIYHIRFVFRTGNLASNTKRSAVIAGQVDFRISPSIAIVISRRRGTDRVKIRGRKKSHHRTVR